MQFFNSVISILPEVKGPTEKHLPFNKKLKWTLLILIAFFVLGIIATWWVVVTAFIVINAFQWGLSKIDEGYQLNIIKSSKFKATLLSTGSQIDLAVAAVSSFGVGFLIDRVSYQYGFLYSGIIFFAILFPLYLYIAHRYKTGIYKNTGTVS